MLMLKTDKPQRIEVAACKQCNAIWFDQPTYDSLPELAYDAMNSMPMQTTEIIAMERLEELKKRMEQERKQARRKKLLHRPPNQSRDPNSEPPNRPAS